ncbi:MAG: ATP-binding protein, partial [Myxococcota bacterium]
MALGSSALSLEIPSRYDQVTDVWVQLERRLHTHFGTAIDEELITVRLAVTEGIVNAIRHAHKEDGRSMKVELVITLSDFMIRIYDTGPGFH